MSKPPSSKSQARTSGSKIPTPTTKPGSRNVVLPALTTIKYSIDIDVIKCRLCKDVFKSPRVLPCGHSACFVCLESLILYTDSATTKDGFPCPVCGRRTKPRDTNVVKQKWPSQFPVNAVVVQMLRNASLRNPLDNSIHRAFCEICLLNNTTRTVVAHCKTCAEHFCDICYKHHEKREDARDHEMVLCVPREEIERGDTTKDWMRKASIGDISGQVEKKVKSRDPRKGQQEPVLIAQTVTASDAGNEKRVIKLGGFSGKTPGDTTTSDFRGGTFLSDGKVVLSDIANKKIKVFDVSHKTRIELICDMSLRVDPSHVCRVDASTVAVLTDRAGNYHIRLFTIREKILHFVHRSVDTIPLGIGCIKSTIVCSFLGNNVLNKYRLSRAQQIKLGSIKHDVTGNDLFRHPGAICHGEFQGTPALFVADETEFGITVICISLTGERKHSVFLECNGDRSKPQSAKKSNGTVKSAGRVVRTKSGRSLVKKEDVSDFATGKTGSDAEITVQKQMTDKRFSSQSREKTSERMSGRHTFRRVDDPSRTIVDKKEVKEIERVHMSDTLKKELSLDLAKITDEVIESVDKTSRSKASGKEGNKAVERARKRPIGKVVPQPSKDSDIGKNGGANSNSDPNSTITSNGSPNLNSTIGTVAFKSPPKLVYRADSISVDKDGNIYICMSSANKVIQLSGDGRVKYDVLTEKDGVIAPKIVAFSPSNDMFFVTCLKSNRVQMFRMK